MKTIILGILTCLGAGITFIVVLAANRKTMGDLAFYFAFGSAIAPLLVAALFMVHSKFRKRNAYLAIAFILSLVFLFGELSHVSHTNKKESIASVSGSDSAERYLLAQADNLNKDLPFQIDEEVIWERCSAEPGRRFTITFKLVNFASGDLNPTVFAEETRPSLVENFCKADSTKGFRKYDVSVEYNYHGKDGIGITSILISNKDCL